MSIPGLTAECSMAFQRPYPGSNSAKRSVHLNPGISPAMINTSGSVSVDARATRNVVFSARLQGISGVEAGPAVAA